MRTVVKWLTGSGFVLGALAGGCADQTGGQDTSVGSAYAELERAVQDCAETRQSCVEAAADDAALIEACEADFQACAASETQVPEEQLASAAAECAAEAKACREQSDDKRSCQEAMRTCLGAGDGRGAQGAPHSDGGLPGNAEPPGSQGRGDVPQRQCRDEMRTCMEQDGVPRECAAAARECVTAIVGGNAANDDATDDDATDDDEADDATDDDDADEDTADDDDADDDTADDDTADDDADDDTADDQVEDETPGSRPDMAGQGRGGQGGRPDQAGSAQGQRPDHAGV